MTLEKDYNLISFKELVVKFGRDCRTVRRWLKDNEIKPLKPFDCKCIYYDLEAIESALKRLTK